MKVAIIAISVVDTDSFRETEETDEQVIDLLKKDKAFQMDVFDWDEAQIVVVP